MAYSTPVILTFPRRNSFVVGLVCAFAFVVAFRIWNHAGTRGGIRAVSPNGLYTLSVMAPLSPTLGGQYDIELIDAETSVVVRHIVVSVPRSEQTSALRGRGGDIAWDPDNMFADVQISGKDAIRIWVP